MNSSIRSKLAIFATLTGLLASGFVGSSYAATIKCFNNDEGQRVCKSVNNNDDYYNYHPGGLTGVDNVEGNKYYRDNEYGGYHEHNNGFSDHGGRGGRR